MKLHPYVSLHPYGVIYIQVSVWYVWNEAQISPVTWARTATCAPQKHEHSNANPGIPRLQPNRRMACLQQKATRSCVCTNLDPDHNSNETPFILDSLRPQAIHTETPAMQTQKDSRLGLVVDRNTKVATERWRVCSKKLRVPAFVPIWTQTTTQTRLHSSWTH